MSALPWYAWYAGDYRVKTSHLDFIHDSAYRKLLDAYYDRGGLLDYDRGGLFRITGAFKPEEQSAIDEIIAEFFTIVNNMLRHERGDIEIGKQASIRLRLSNAGKRGGAIAGRGRPKGSDRGGSGKGTSTVQRSNPIAPSGAFAHFWSAYPKKKSKGQAEKAWRRCANGNADAIMAGLDAAKASADWRKDNGKFIPHPATWLNARGWEDEQQTEERRQFVI